MGFLIDLAWTAAGIAGLALSVWVIQLSLRDGIRRLRVSSSPAHRFAPVGFSCIHRVMCRARRQAHKKR